MVVHMLRWITVHGTRCLLMRTAKGIRVSDSMRPGMAGRKRDLSSIKLALQSDTSPMRRAAHIPKGRPTESPTYVSGMSSNRRTQVCSGIVGSAEVTRGMGCSSLRSAAAPLMRGYSRGQPSLPAAGVKEKREQTKIFAHIYALAFDWVR